MLTFHPIANVFPLLEGKEFTALIDNIQATGVLEPVWLYEDMILDGRNRYRACACLEIECPARVYTGDDPVGFVLSMNLTRRHLDESQRAMVAARLSDMRRGRPEINTEISSLSQVDAAQLLHVSHDSILSARKVQQQGIPELTHAVDTGEMAVSAALPLTAFPKEEQLAALTESRRAAKGHKVTATITKAIVTRQEVLSTLQSALDDGVPSSTAIKHALTTHAIALPTPGLADALARAVPEPVSIPATDGLYHDGRTPQEEGDRKEYVKQLFQLFRALEGLATLPDPAEMVGDIPEYSAFRVDDHLPQALAWLQTFAALWRRDHGEYHQTQADLIRSH